MKRLTQKDESGWYLTGDGIYSDWSVPEKFRGEDIDHLAAIEDILGDEYDLDELKEVVQSKRKGRCIVLPCKKGDVVWRIVNDANPYITKDRCTEIVLENGNVWAHLIGDRVMGGWNFGKLLFLTREAAEEALKAREQE